MTISTPVSGPSHSIAYGRQLSEYFRAGNEPDVMESPVRLRAGEVLHYQVQFELLQWAEGDFHVQAGGRPLPMLGNSRAVMVGALIGGAVASQRMQRKVNRLNAASWRLIAGGNVLVTSDRFLLGTNGGWQEVDYDSILKAECDANSVILTIPGMPPTALRVAHPHYLYVLYKKVAHNELVFV